MRIRLADLNMEINFSTPELSLFFSGYETAAPADFEISVTSEERKAEVDALLIPISESEAELNALYRKISGILSAYDGFLLHAAVIAVEGHGYAFAAPSGTGKSTHVRYWMQKFGDALTVVNGDKPLIRAIDGVFYAYGTPWCGKENWQKNMRIPLNGLCFFERSDRNFIEKAEPANFVSRLFSQVLLPSDSEKMALLLPVLDRFLQVVPMYRLGCTLSPEAADIAYNGLRGI